MKVPSGGELIALQPILPVFPSYLLSFVYIGIYWNNHHHMLHTVSHVSGAILWANLHLLFWLSLFPFALMWLIPDRRIGRVLGENSSLPVDRIGE